jgi:ER degradation enhancer, mannosidase alpha-like 2
MKICRTLLILSVLFTTAVRSDDSDLIYLDAEHYARIVKEEFLFAWNGYRTYAWGYDGLRPQSNTGYNWYPETLHLSAVEALSTMLLMGLDDEFETAKEQVLANLSFDRDIYVKNFEITIRMLGGLLSAYQLSGEEGFLNLADDLGKRLLPAFNSPTGMPYVYVNLQTGAVRGTESNPAEIGTLLIEFGTLSKLTGNREYYDKAKRALAALYERRSPLDLVGTKIDITSGEWLDTRSHIGAAIDSYYEYLLKCWLLFDDEECLTMWEVSRSAIDTYLADETDFGHWYGHVDMYTGDRVRTWYGALDAFFGGVLVLAEDVERARRLQDAGYFIWMKHGLQPEQFDYGTLSIVRHPYYLNPELIESAYYLYRATGDTRYRQMGVHFLESLQRYCKTGSGFADVMNQETKETSDRMESYFLAETLKYLYLLFSDPGLLDLETTVFNTEAHPIQKNWK